METSTSEATVAGAPPVAETPQAPLQAAPASPLKLIWQALWFQDSAFAEVRDSKNPLVRGLIIALILSAIAGAAGALGLGFDRLTSPSLQEVRSTVLEGVQKMPWYQDMVSGPTGDQFEKQFRQGYDLWWQFMPGVLGFPSLSSAATTLCLTPIAGVIRWAIMGALTYLAARLLGGKGGFGPTLGVMALASAPQIFTVAAILPGFLAGSLTGWWSLALAYWAVRSAHGLSWQRNLLAVLLPRIVIALLAFILGAIGAAIAVSALSAR